MSSTQGTQQVRQFGSYQLRVQTRELSRHGQVITIEPRVFDLLVFLLDNRDRVVSKDEIHTAVWPDRYVSEASLSRAIMKCRRAVGDDANQQHTIKTIHGRGYRFVAELTDRSPEAGLQPDRKMNHPPLKWLLFGVVLVALVLMVSTFFNQEPETLDSADGARIAILPVYNNTNDPDMEWVEFGLMDVLGSQLRQVYGVPVVESDEVVRTVGQYEDALLPDLAVSAENIEALFQEYSASHIVISSLSRPGQLFQLRSQIFSPSGTPITLEVMGNEPLDLVSELRRQLESNLPGSGPTEVAPDSVSDDHFVNEAYVRGRDLLLRGDLQQARTLLQVAVDQEPDNLRALHALATVVLNLGDAEAALDMSRDLISKARLSGDRFGEASGHFLLGNTLLRQRDFEAANAQYENALTIFEDLNMPFEEGKVLSNMAIIAGEHHELMAERALLERAASAFSEAGLKNITAPVMGGLANNALDRGELEEAQRYFESALTEFRRQGRKDQEAVSLYSMSRVALFQGDFALARSYAQESVGIAREIGHLWGLAASLRLLGSITRDSGNFELSSEFFGEALEISRSVDAPADIASILVNLAELDRLSGRLEQASARLNEAFQLAVDADDEIGRTWVDLQRGSLQLDQGDFESAITLAERSLSENSSQIPSVDVESNELMARAHLVAGKPNQALAAYQDAYAAVERTSNRHRRAQLAAEMGLICLDLERKDEANGYLGVAREASPGAFEVHLLAASLLAKDGDYRAAIAEFDVAQQTAADLWTASRERLRDQALADNR